MRWWPPWVKSIWRLYSVSCGQWSHSGQALVRKGASFNAFACRQWPGNHLVGWPINSRTARAHWPLPMRAAANYLIRSFPGQRSPMTRRTKGQRSMWSRVTDSVIHVRCRIKIFKLFGTHTNAQTIGVSPEWRTRSGSVASPSEVRSSRV